ncbi:MAG: hypothetical protein ACM3PR_06585, partial [Bacteroidales bacterium]
MITDHRLALHTPCLLPLLPLNSGFIRYLPKGLLAPGTWGQEMLRAGAGFNESGLFCKVPPTNRANSQQLELINYPYVKLFYVLVVYRFIIIMWDMQNEPFIIENLYKIS